LQDAIEQVESARVLALEVNGVASGVGSHAARDAGNAERSVGRVS
jgi:hypothetical protein